MTVWCPSALSFWLDQAGLLTSRVPSRTPDGSTSASLDELRSGQAGELLPKPKSSALFTNAFLPPLQ